MTPAVRTVGDERALKLAACPDGHAGTAVTVSFGDSGDADVTWYDRVDPGGSDNGRRPIATIGPNLWRRAPWPAADDLFELDPPSRRSILVVGAPDERLEIAEFLEDYADNVSAVEALDRGGLEEAAVVAFAQPVGEPLPAEAPAILAAGRMLVLRSPSLSFGFVAGIDYLCARRPGAIAELAASASRNWDDFAAIRAFGRVAAEAHRASTVYARIAADVAAGR